jgi:hypothetical protein
MLMILNVQFWIVLCFCISSIYSINLLSDHVSVCQWIIELLFRYQSKCQLVQKTHNFTILMMFYWWRKWVPGNNLSQVTDKLYHIIIYQVHPIWDRIRTQFLCKVFCYKRTRVEIYIYLNVRLPSFCLTRHTQSKVNIYFGKESFENILI